MSSLHQLVSQDPSHGEAGFIGVEPCAGVNRLLPDHSIRSMTEYFHAMKMGILYLKILVEKTGHHLIEGVTDNSPKNQPVSPTPTL